MTDPQAEHGERLRAALHAAADSVVPSGDGLERIFGRIAPEPVLDSFGLGLFRGWLRSVAAEFRVGLPYLRPVTAARRPVRLPAAASHQIRVRSHRLDRGGAEARRAAATASLRGDRLRPALAAAGAILVAAAAILAIPGLRQNATMRISSLMHSAGQLTRDHHGRPKPPASHPAIASGPGTQRPSPTTPFTAPPRRSSARPSHRPKHPTTPPTTCAPVPGQVSPAATAAAPRPTSTTALRPTRTTCRTPTRTLTWPPTPTPTQATPPTPTPTLSPTPSATPTRQGSGQPRGPRHWRHWRRHHCCHADAPNG
jgi:hypothetical protein